MRLKGLSPIALILDDFDPEPREGGITIDSLTEEDQTMWKFTPAPIEHSYGRFLCIQRGCKKSVHRVTEKQFPKANTSQLFILSKFCELHQGSP